MMTPQTATTQSTDYQANTQQVHLESYFDTFLKSHFPSAKKTSFCLAEYSDSNTIYMPDEYVGRILLQ